jgi:DNA-binding MarR family transcriptional regulator
MDHPPDAVDHLLAAWRAARPDLDPSALGLVGRVIVLAGHLERSVEEALAEHRLTLGQFDILATLRRHGPKGGLTPTALLRSVVLSSGGMTSRLDKLEASGLIARSPDAADRRGVVVTLTAKGKKVIDAATATRFREAERSLPPFTAGQLNLLTDLLRQWLGRVAPAEEGRGGDERE